MNTTGDQSWVPEACTLPTVFAFTFAPGDGALRLEVEVPAVHVAVLDALGERAAAGIQP